MRSRQLHRWLIPLSLLLIVLIGCQRQETDGRNVQQTDDKQITVKDNPEKTTYDETAVDDLVRLDDVRGMDWLSEDAIIVDRENTTFPPEEAEGAKWYPHNLYTRSLLTNEQTPLYPENRNQGFAQVSPDRSKLFYKTFDLTSNTGQGYLMDLTTRHTAAFTDKDAMDIQNGRWVDNNSVVYATIDGTIYLANAENTVPRKLLETGIPFVSNVAYMNDQLYYTTLKGTVLSQELDKKPLKTSLNNVQWIIPSPDEQRLAIVRRIKSGEVELLITDLQGTTLHAVAQDSQIYGSAWSPDGTRLAYASYAPNGTVRGIYVADTSTGLSTPLSVDIKFIGDPLHWSPTGTRLMITATELDEQKSRNRFVTYLVRASLALEPDGKAANDK
ncbi:hypothetical protein [Cohnella silvisoli]|uniref:Lipoprotein LpqB beta-propeller domain-containing protein n=1 Tax=Cohnella silvisoli TaxID=2873699 RepID=A0ABV1KY27_9BACL|nr:hypothetical protein [Cohnella silvisoli]MCD9023991.1 hypothetical protein [Cohnella silvisoli]